MTLDDATWWKSSYTTKDGMCVEVANLDTHGQWAIRDSKNRTGPALVIPRPQWAAFTVGVRADQFGG